MRKAHRRSHAPQASDQTLPLLRRQATLHRGYVFADQYRRSGGALMRSASWPTRVGGLALRIRQLSATFTPTAPLRGRPRKVKRYYFQCKCGQLRGRNARSPCACGRPPASWSPDTVRAWLASRRKHKRWLAKNGYCICRGCGIIRYADSTCSRCGERPRNLRHLVRRKRIQAGE